MNFLEQLVAEWFTLQGYFVQTNLKFGKRGKGGWTGEIDVAAFNPSSRELVHVETSMDADRWEQRRERFARKFTSASRYLQHLFSFEITRVRRVAIVGFSFTSRPRALGEGVEDKSLAQFVREVSEGLRERHPLKSAIPETLPLLRAMQFAIHWGRPETTVGSKQRMSVAR